MYLKSFHIRNFRRLNDVHVDLEQQTTIFVGSNNSGKTAATQIFKLFLDSKERFYIHDFSAHCWPELDRIGANQSLDAQLPTIELDLWFTVEKNDLHRVIDILPSLDWKDSPVGIRLVYAPKDQSELLMRFHDARTKAAASAEPPGENGEGGFHPWPEKLTDYLTKKLKDEYRIFYYVLDHSEFDEDYHQNTNYVPQQLSDTAEGGRRIVESLIKVDFLSAQRHQSDTQAKGRSETLSARLSRFYDRNLEKFDHDQSAMKALAQSEEQLNKHLEKVFEPTLQMLNRLGYPGFANPDLVIKSAFDPESVLARSANVHYALRDPESMSGESIENFAPPTADTEPPVAAQQYLTLPDKYNGLGFKNLIYMVVEVLDFHFRWADQEEARAPVHLIFIEEPEAHLHVQLQQVFVKKITEILPNEAPIFRNQLVITTHSPHIIYESSFTPIRYFQRLKTSGTGHYSKVLNLSNFHEDNESTIRFLRQYMKLTHCDLFFADAAVFVEGNVERLLLPLMIDRVAPDLKSSYLSILELGGAFAHLFKNLVSFLGITTLIITDLDSAEAPTPEKSKDKSSKRGKGSIPPSDLSEEEQDDGDDELADSKSHGKACPAWTPNAVTSNQTLIEWLPRLREISELLSADDSKKIEYRADRSSGNIRVAYQTNQDILWNEERKTLAGRTFEESFALENLTWCHNEEQRHLKLRVGGRKAVSKMNLEQAAEKLYKKIRSDNFDKTEFALALMMVDGDWRVPSYISDGLVWLSSQLVPPVVEPIAAAMDKLPSASTPATSPDGKPLKSNQTTTDSFRSPDTSSEANKR